MNIARRQLAGLALLLAGLMIMPVAVNAQGSTIDAIKKRGKIQVGFGSFVPWAMRDKQGNWIGFEIDVTSKLAKDMGVEVDLMPTAWDAVIPSLLAGKFDAIFGMTVTDARKEQVDFTEAYSQSGQGVAASKQIASGLKWPEGYNDAKVTFACRRGIAACKVIEERWPKATLRQFDDDAIAFQEVINGNAHAVMSSEPKPTFFTLQNQDKLFRPTTDYVTTGMEGFAIKKGNPETIAYFNDWIANNKDWLKERHNYWFKTRDWAEKVAAN